MKMKKQQKKFESYELKKKKYINEDYQQVQSFFVISIIVLIFACGLFVINAKYVSKDKFQNNASDIADVKIDSSLTTVDGMFNITDNEYLVLLYDSNDTKTKSVYENILKFYYGTIPLYKVDLASKMNSKYYDLKNVDNENPKNSSEVSVNGLTLIEFNKGKVSSYLTDVDKIIERVKKL